MVSFSWQFILPSWSWVFISKPFLNIHPPICIQLLQHCKGSSLSVLTPINGKLKIISTVGIRTHDLIVVNISTSSNFKQSFDIISFFSLKQLDFRFFKFGQSTSTLHSFGRMDGLKRDAIIVTKNDEHNSVQRTKKNDWNGITSLRKKAKTRKKDLKEKKDFKRKKIWKIWKRRKAWKCD